MVRSRDEVTTCWSVGRRHEGGHIRLLPVTLCWPISRTDVRVTWHERGSPHWQVLRSIGWTQVCSNHVHPRPERRQVAYHIVTVNVSKPISSVVLPPNPLLCPRSDCYFGHYNRSFSYLLTVSVLLTIVKLVCSHEWMHEDASVSADIHSRAPRAIHFAAIWHWHWHWHFIYIAFTYLICQRSCHTAVSDSRIKYVLISAVGQQHSVNTLRHALEILLLAFFLLACICMYNRITHIASDSLQWSAVLHSKLTFCFQISTIRNK